MPMYKLVYFEISGVCNARCPWCVQGNGRLKSYHSRFIPPSEFEKAIGKLIDEAIIGPDSIVDLYNYGEPLLHPSLHEILRVLADNNVKFTISTNASKCTDIDPASLT